MSLQACKTVAGASTLMRISWDEAHGIMTRAVERGPLRRDEVDMPHLAAEYPSDTPAYPITCPWYPFELPPFGAAILFFCGGLNLAP